MKKDSIVADLGGSCMARYALKPYDFPILTIMSPAESVDWGLVPAQSITLHKEGIKSLVEVLIDAGYCSPRSPLLLSPGKGPEAVTACAMTQHSKGPWRPSPDGVPYGSIVCDDPSGRNFDERYTAEQEREFYGGYMVAESVAPRNRNLIAAAPDLLEALRGLLAIVADSDGVAGFHRNGEVAAWDEFPEVGAALGVIAKATGQEVGHG